MSVARTELALQGYTTEAESMIRDALERADLSVGDRARFPGLRSLGHVHMMRTDFDQTAAVAAEVMAIVEEEKDPVLLAEAHILAGMSAGWLVDFPSVSSTTTRRSSMRMRRSWDASTFGSARTRWSSPMACPG